MTITVDQNKRRLGITSPMICGCGDYKNTALTKYFVCGDISRYFDTDYITFPYIG